jgi:hypothetical protein
VVRWRDDGGQRARRFSSEAEAIAFHEGVTGGVAKPGSSTPNVYPYETSAGTRWRYSYRDSRGRLSTKRGFLTERAAARDREERMGRVRQGTVVVSRMSFGEFFPDWLRRRRPYVTAGTWADYEVHGRKRLLPHFGESRLTAITTYEVSDWLLELHEAGDYAPKTLNNALGVLVAALNGAVADQRHVPPSCLLRARRPPELSARLASERLFEPCATARDCVAPTPGWRRRCPVPAGAVARHRSAPARRRISRTAPGPARLSGAHG